MNFYDQGLPILGGLVVFSLILIPAHRMPLQPTWIFDFDSTLVRVEALDELADIALAGVPDRQVQLERIRQVTRLGMEGAMSIEQSLQSRLALLSLRPEMIPALIERLVANFTPSFWRLRDRLAMMRDQIWVVSGGCHEWIEPTVSRLGLRTDQVIANRLRRRSDGTLELDPHSPCAVDHGKATAIMARNLAKPRIMVGDGMTDWQVRELNACETFVCFTEVVHRESVATKADAVAASLEEVLAIDIQSTPES